MTQLAPGKMVRTQLAAQLSAAVDRSPPPPLVQACAAIELLHTASLCHDDVIDEAPVRRHRQALWRTSSKATAVLIGDILLCHSLDLIVEADGGRYLAPFLAKTREVCEAEAEQELVLRHCPMDEDTCLRVARSKTGPLFAFVAGVCGGNDPRLTQVLEEVGYCVGTIYQLADDVLDVAGCEALAGKTLGTDAGRGKLTLPQQPRAGVGVTVKQIQAIAWRARELLVPWPSARSALDEYLVTGVQSVFGRQLPDVDIRILLNEVSPTGVQGQP
jgi:geranylgeranyl pyrophosphate synthase